MKIKNFFKQIFKFNNWETLTEDAEVIIQDRISDFWIIFINFTSTFLLFWLISSQVIESLFWGLGFGILSTIKCYYEFWKQIKVKKYQK